MDLHVRFMDNSNQVRSNYLDSSFMGHGTASDCLSHFNTLTKYFLSKLIQLSMDGPYVNLKIYRDFSSGTFLQNILISHYYILECMGYTVCTMHSKQL